MPSLRLQLFWLAANGLCDSCGRHKFSRRQHCSRPTRDTLNWAELQPMNSTMCYLSNGNCAIDLIRFDATQMAIWRHFQCKLHRKCSELDCVDWKKILLFSVRSVWRNWAIEQIFTIIFFVHCAQSVFSLVDAEFTEIIFLFFADRMHRSSWTVVLMCDKTASSQVSHFYFVLSHANQFMANHANVIFHSIDCFDGFCRQISLSKH